MDELVSIGFLVLIVLILILMAFFKAAKSMEKHIGRGATARLLYPVGMFLITIILGVIVFIFMAASM